MSSCSPGPNVAKVGASGRGPRPGARGTYRCSRAGSGSRPPSAGTAASPAGRGVAPAQRQQRRHRALHRHLLSSWIPADRSLGRARGGRQAARAPSLEDHAVERDHRRAARRLQARGAPAPALPDALTLATPWAPGARKPRGHSASDGDDSSATAGPRTGQVRPASQRPSRPATPIGTSPATWSDRPRNQLRVLPRTGRSVRGARWRGECRALRARRGWSLHSAARGAGVPAVVPGVSVPSRTRIAGACLTTSRGSGHAVVVEYGTPR